MNPISPANIPMFSPPAVPSLSGPAKNESSFRDALAHSIHEVNRMQQDADHAVEALATGGDVEPATVLSAVQKADLAFRMMMQVRNKLIEAYQEIKDVRI
jgi:flagellar hook-basal body complex protein FliE